MGRVLVDKLAQRHVLGIIEMNSGRSDAAGHSPLRVSSPQAFLSHTLHFLSKVLKMETPCEMGNHLKLMWSSRQRQRLCGVFVDTPFSIEIVATCIMLK